MANSMPGLTSGLADNPAAAIFRGDALDDAHVVAACHQHKTRKLLALADPALVTQEELVASRRRKHVVTASNFDGTIPAWGLLMLTAMDQIKQQQVQDTNQIMEAIQQMNRTQQQTNRTMQRQLQQLQDITQNIAENQQQLIRTIAENQQDTNQNIAAIQQHMERRMQQERQRAMNRARIPNMDRIVPLIRLSDGKNPTNGPDNLWFPVYHLELLDAPMNRVKPLLEFYSLVEDDDDDDDEEEAVIREKRARVLAFLGLSVQFLTQG